MLRYMYICTSSAKADKTWCPVFLSQEAQHNYMYVHVFCWKFSLFLLHQTPYRNFVNLVSVPKRAGMFCL